VSIFFRFPMAVRPKDLTVAGPYTLTKFLGEGSFGVVKLGVHNKTGDLVAVKIIPQAELTKNEKLLRRVEMEVNILRLIDHPCVTKYVACFQTPGYLFIVLEYMEGGDLYELLRSKGSKGLPMATVFKYFYCILSALEYCHSCCISHRDLKLENILLDGKGEVAKLSDFGMANLTPDNMMETSCGSPHYAAPEVIRGQKYNGTKSDVWGLAVLLFVLCAGRLPFDSHSIPRVLDKVCEGQYTMPDHFDGFLRHLLSHMFVVPVDKRYGIKDIKRHPWYLAYCKKLNLDPRGFHAKDPTLRPEGGDAADDLEAAQVAQLTTHPALHCDIRDLHPLERRSKFEDLQALGRQLIQLHGARAPAAAVLHPEDMQLPIPEPFDVEIVQFIALCQGLADGPALQATLRDRKPTPEKAFYRLLQQQKQQCGSLVHLSAMPALRTTDPARPATASAKGGAAVEDDKGDAEARKEKDKKGFGLMSVFKPKDKDEKASDPSTPKKSPP